MPLCLIEVPKQDVNYDASALIGTSITRLADTIRHYQLLCDSLLEKEASPLRLPLMPVQEYIANHGPSCPRSLANYAESTDQGHANCSQKLSDSLSFSLI